MYVQMGLVMIPFVTMAIRILSLVMSLAGNDKLIFRCAFYLGPLTLLFYLTCHTFWVKFPNFISLLFYFFGQFRVPILFLSPQLWTALLFIFFLPVIWMTPQSALYCLKDTISLTSFSLPLLLVLSHTCTLLFINNPDQSLYSCSYFLNLSATCHLSCVTKMFQDCAVRASDSCSPVTSLISLCLFPCQPSYLTETIKIIHEAVSLRFQFTFPSAFKHLTTVELLGECYDHSSYFCLIFSHISFTSVQPLRLRFLAHWGKSISLNIRQVLFSQAESSSLLLADSTPVGISNEYCCIFKAQTEASYLWTDEINWTPEIELLLRKTSASKNKPYL